MFVSRASDPVWLVEQSRAEAEHNRKHTSRLATSHSSFPPCVVKYIPLELELELWRGGAPRGGGGGVGVGGGIEEAGGRGCFYAELLLLLGSIADGVAGFPQTGTAWAEGKPTGKERESARATGKRVAASSRGPAGAND